MMVATEMSSGDKSELCDHSTTFNLGRKVGSMICFCRKLESWYLV